MLLSRLFILVVYLAAICVPANAGRYIFDEFGKRLGIPYGNAYQDRAGILWFGGLQGVYRYDGERAKRFDSSEGLPSNVVTGFASTADGTVWVGTMSGLARFDGLRFHKERGNPVYDLATDRTGKLYIREQRLVRATHDAASHKWIFTETPPDDLEAGTLFFTPDNHLWLGCGKEICHLTPTGSIERFGRQHGLPDAEFQTVLVDGSGTVWTRGNAGLYAKAPGQTKFVEVDTPTATGNTRAAMVDSKGRLWSADGIGFAIRDGAHWNRVGNARGIKDTVHGIVETRSHEIIIVPSGSGPVQWVGRQDWELWGEPEGLTGPVLPVSRVDDNLWVSTLAGTYVAGMDMLFRRVTAVPEKSIAVGFGKDGNDVLIGTSNQGLRRASPTGDLRGVVQHASGSTTYGASTILRDQDGTLLVLSGRGLMRAEGSGASMRLHTIDVPGWTSTRYRQMAFDHAKRLWIASGLGLAVRDNGRWYTFGKRDGLVHDSLQCLATASGDSVWIGYDTPLGFTRVRYKSPGKITTEHFDAAHGYGGNGTFTFHETSQGWIWRGAAGGLQVSDLKDPSPGSWITFAEANAFGAPNQYGFFEDTDHSIWIGADAGLYHFTPPPDLFERYRHPPDVAISSIQWSGGPRMYSAAAPALGRSVNIQLADVSYRKPARPEYRYRLSGAWQPIKGSEFDLQSLWPGTYSLEISGRNGNGSWSDPIRYQFQVPVPTWITYSSGVTLALLITGSAAFLGRRARQRSREKLAADIKEIFGTARQLTGTDRDAYLDRMAHRQGQAVAEARRLLDTASHSGFTLDPDGIWNHALPTWAGDPNPQPNALQKGDILQDRYLIEGLLSAQGGFADVYLARDQRLFSRPTVIKIQRRRPADEEWLDKRLRAEIEALGRISHPGVVSPVDHGHLPDGRAYLAMEYIEGPTLRELIRSGPMESARAGRLLAHFGQALQAAHDAGVLHRDLKPENLILRHANTADERIVIIDFGIAIVQQGLDGGTQASRAAGSLEYMAPEQTLGKASASSDVYGMAIIAFEMFTGVRPAAFAADPQQVEALVPSRLRDRRPDLPLDAGPLLASCLRVIPRDRALTAAELGQRLSAALQPA